ncbi:MAG: T9SS type A sorting domain-containing protein [Chlorobi bacterium]|nr:T9SS type A sorting domain-containing protein [Chlorobiota bacterium]
MSVYDLFGRKVYEAYDLFIGGDRHEINVRDWAPGHYLVCLHINGEVVTRRFILSR